MNPFLISPSVLLMTNWWNFMVNFDDFLLVLSMGNHRGVYMSFHVALSSICDISPISVPFFHLFYFNYCPVSVFFLMLVTMFRSHGSGTTGFCFQHYAFFAVPYILLAFVSDQNSNHHHRFVSSHLISSHLVFNATFDLTITASQPLLRYISCYCFSLH